MFVFEIRFALLGVHVHVVELYITAVKQKTWND